MKLILSLSLLAAFSSGAAFADFLPGRVRPVALAEMKAVEATGEFSAMTQAMLYQNFQDDKGFVSLKLALKGGKAITLPVSKVQEGGCGNYAWSDEVKVGSHTVNTEFSDFSEAICTVFVDKTWKLKVDMTDAQGNRSTLVLVGNPEPLFVTL